MALKPKQTVPEEDRTEDRDKAANEIMEFLEAGNSFNAEALGQLGEYSPQHYRNAREYYFEQVDRESVSEKKLAPEYRTDTVVRGGVEPETHASVGREQATDGGSVSISVEIPAGVDREAYLRGYLAGRLDEKNKT